MFSPFLGAFGTLAILVGMCQTGNVDRSSLAPLSIVYTVYPYYNSDTLLGILKAEEPLQISNDLIALGRQLETQQARNTAVSGAHDGTSGSTDRKSSHDDSNESATARNEATAEITYWPPVQRGASPKPRLIRTTGPQI